MFFISVSVQFNTEIVFGAFYTEIYTAIIDWIILGIRHLTYIYVLDSTSRSLYTISVHQIMHSWAIIPSILLIVNQEPNFAVIASIILSWFCLY